MIRPRIEYSDKERLLLQHFEIPEALMQHSVQSAYQEAVNEAFISLNIEDEWVQSLRRCWRAFRNHSPYRLTPEWDELIEVE